MSVTLSTISRQLDPSMTMVFQSQVVQPSSEYSGISGISTSSVGPLPSASCQTNSRPLLTSVIQLRVRASFGVRLAYGTSLHLPSPPQRQSWNGHATLSPLMEP
ncbi:Uncharacterised protein [Mycobacteroides abscessus]|nr:Uncharacterised protein [Mycobacteroides abscessus]SHZ68741.1 Uncharacterised protein [Mycobacteroides abscessus subsp. abscessus]